MKVFLTLLFFLGSVVFMPAVQAKDYDMNLSTQKAAMTMSPESFKKNDKFTTAAIKKTDLFNIYCRASYVPKREVPKPFKLSLNTKLIYVLVDKDGANPVATTINLGNITRDELGFKSLTATPIQIPKKEGKTLDNSHFEFEVLEDVVGEANTFQCVLQ